MVEMMIVTVGELVYARTYRGQIFECQPRRIGGIAPLGDEARRTLAAFGATSFKVDRAAFPMEVYPLNDNPRFLLLAPACGGRIRLEDGKEDLRLTSQSGRGLWIIVRSPLECLWAGSIPSA